MRLYRITTDSPEHIKSLVSDYIKDGYKLILQVGTTAILTDGNNEIRIDLV